MLYLILAMVSSMLVSVFMRMSESRAKNNLSMLAVNYAMCLILSMAYAGPMDLFPAEQGIAFTAGWGVLSGVMYLVSFMLLQWNIKKNGVVLPATFMKLGVLVPTLLSIAAFGEVPGVLQVLGVLLAVSAIILINTGKGEQKAASILGLVVLLLSGGLTDFTSKFYEVLGSASLSNHYLLYTFFMALILCVMLVLAKRQRMTGWDAAYGLLLGIPNYYSARFLLASLSSVPAVVAYPTVNAGTIVLVTLAGVLVFGERLSRRQWLALSIILLALVLLNL